MTERTQVTEVIADFKMGTVGLDGAAERLAAILGMTDADVLRDILSDGENDPSEQIVDEIDAEYDLDYDEGDRDFDDDEDDDLFLEAEPDPIEGDEFGGEA